MLDASSDAEAGAAPAGQFAGHVGVVWVAGEDRLDFLHRMSTGRLADLAPGQGRATAFTTDAGRVVDQVTCHVGQDGVVLVTSGPGAALILAEHLRRYVLFADRVRVTDASNQVVVTRLLGPGARAAAEVGAQSDASSLAPGDWRVVRDGHAETWLLRHADPGGMQGFDLVAPAGGPAESIAGRLAAWGANVLTTDQYSGARVLLGRPQFGAEIDGTTNPYELGLDDLVSDDKGCYIGQEVLARLVTYEKVQRRLVALLLADAIEVGEAVLSAADAVELGRDETGGPPGTADADDTETTSESPPAGRSAGRSAGRRTGRVTTAAMLGDGRWAALALVPQDVEPGAPVIVATANGPTVTRALAPGGPAPGDAAPGRDEPGDEAPTEDGPGEDVPGEDGDRD